MTTLSLRRLALAFLLLAAAPLVVRADQAPHCCSVKRMPRLPTKPFIITIEISYRLSVPVPGKCSYPSPRRPDTRISAASKNQPRYCSTSSKTLLAQTTSPTSIPRSLLGSMSSRTRPGKTSVTKASPVKASGPSVRPLTFRLDC